MVPWWAGLPNRQALERRLASSLDPPRWLGLANLDRFTRFNQVFSHIAGDQLLEQVAAISREVAIHCGASVYHLGADRFCFLSGQHEASGMSTLLAELQGRVAGLRVSHVLDANSPSGHISVSVAQRSLPGCPVIRPGLLFESLMEEMESKRALSMRSAAGSSNDA